MESITRNVGELTQSERQVYEIALGKPLRDGQKVILQLVDEEATRRDQAPKHAAGDTSSASNGAASQLPDWCAVYRGLSDAEIDAVEKSILFRSSTSRKVELDL